MTARHPLIGHLVNMVDREDRGALAVLRRAASAEPGCSADSFPHVLPWVPEDARRNGDEDLYFLVATLFAIHPDHRETGNFGATMWRTATDGGAEPNPSADLRFRRILEANRSDLPDLMRQAVRMAATRSSSVAIDYDLLLTQLQSWDHPTRWVQRKWARSYWSPNDESSRTTGA